MEVQPGATYEAVVDWGTTGLTGTLGLTVIDNIGGATVARLTTSITEIPTGSGIYVRVGNVAPTTAGQYTLFWDDGATTPGHVATEELDVTSSATTSNIYVSRAEVKVALNLTGQTYADDDIDDAIAAASRAIDDACGRFFYQDATARYYTPDWCDAVLDLDDLTTLTAFELDMNNDGTFETAWTAGTDFDLEPYNAAAKGWPYEQVQIRFGAGRNWPIHRRSVKVTGTFGWPAVPAGVQQYAKISAVQLLLRSRQAPFGFQAGEMGVGFISRNDPDFKRLVGRYVKTRPIR